MPADIVPDHNCQVDSDLSSSDIGNLMSLINPLSNQIEAAVARAGSGFYFVDVRPIWAGHAVCSSDAWVNGVEITHPDQSYHPNADGQNAYKQAVLQAIQSPSPASAPGSAPSPA